MIIFILLASEPIGESLFIGGLTGLVFYVIYFFFQRSKNKQASKEYVEEVKKEIISNSKVTLSIENTKIPVNCYTSLFKELKEKCNPANFMNPYDAEKVEISNYIFSKLDSNATNIRALIQLRNLAISKLGLSFPAKEIYEKLAEAYNPQKFVGENYDANKLHIANQIYSRIQSSQNNIIELEKIAQESGIVFVKFEMTKDANTENTANCNNDTNQDILDNSNTDNSNTASIVGVICVIIMIVLGFICLMIPDLTREEIRQVENQDTVWNGSVEKRDEEIKKEREIKINDFINYNTTYVISEITILDTNFTPPKDYHYRNGEVKITKSKIIINVGGHNFVSRIVSSRFYIKETDNYSTAEFVTENGKIVFWKDWKHSEFRYFLGGNYNNYHFLPF